MQAHKYIILPLLLIGSTSSLLLGNNDSDNKFKPTFFGRITNRIGNSRLFNPSFETLNRAHNGLLIMIGVAVGQVVDLAYKCYEIEKSIKATKKAIKKKRRELLENEIDTYKNTIAKQKEQLLEAKHQENFIAKQQGEVEYYKNMVDKYQKLVNEIQREQIKQNEPWYNKISNLFNFSKK